MLEALIRLWPLKKGKKMAQIAVDPQVLEAKASTLESAAKQLTALYTEMNNEVVSIAAQMSGRVITEETQTFKNFKSIFDNFDKDIKSFATSLRNTAEAMEKVETTHISELQWP